MPTTLGPKYGPDYTGYPPRMSQEDFLIWQRWWPAHKSAVIALYFDVGLGLPDFLPTTDDAAQLLGWIRNTQKRADVITERDTDVLLIEFRFNAQLNAIGRLQGYQLLLEDDNPFKKPIIPLLVTNRHDSEVERLAILNKIAFEIV
ncbi:MAG TPA: hypothetical protein VGW77_04890 [Candidatus Binatia bacterium]|jgi:hypothetical protein|nr:hypothetical protein [Candidatus Binatia bacterium]